MTLHKIWLVRLIVLIVPLIAVAAIQAQVNVGPPVQFASLSIPVGVETDLNGNVYTTSDNVFNTLITKYAPTGQPLAQARIGNFFSVDTIGKMARVPGTPHIVDLLPNGQLLIINTANGLIIPSYNLRTLPNIVTNEIYDLASGQFGSAAGLIIPQQSSYGDIAVYRNGNTIDLLVSGNSIAFPFIMRVRFIPGQPPQAKVLITSLASAAPLNNVPRGVAVNSQGMVLTSLPFAFDDPQENVDRAVLFHVNLPEERNIDNLPRFLLNRIDFSSRGMASDGVDNFYVATGGIGISQCGVLGSGVMVVISADLNNITCGLVSNAPLIFSEDVAVAPDGSFAYMTVRNFNAVIRYPLLSTSSFSNSISNETDPTALDSPNMFEPITTPFNLIQTTPMTGTIPSTVTTYLLTPTVPVTPGSHLILTEPWLYDPSTLNQVWLPVIQK
ncbi:MAG: hypothetical protein KDJ52_34140 [Anaerolineae bacterium]|nr:hypothetical protein [Anaerolineae bacterium]